MELKNVITQELPEKKEVYVAPVIETIAVRVEKGFQFSPQPSSSSLYSSPSNERPSY